jgi:saccharopepsin
MPLLARSFSTTTTMLLPAVAPFLLIPYVAAAGVHKLKLKKIDPVLANPSLESAYLADKYGVLAPAQTPLFGSGGEGRRLDSRPHQDDLYWTQEDHINGGHKVHLTSSLSRSSSPNSFVKR